MLPLIFAPWYVPASLCYAYKSSLFKPAWKISLWLVKFRGRAGGSGGAIAPLIFLGIGKIVAFSNSNISRLKESDQLIKTLAPPILYTFRRPCEASVQPISRKEEQCSTIAHKYSFHHKFGSSEIFFNLSYFGAKNHFSIARLHFICTN